MHDLQTIVAMNKAAEERYYVEKHKETQVELNTLAHSIAHDSTFGAVDPEKTIRYEALREYLKELEAKCTKA